jgi:hypothetical protein
MEIAQSRHQSDWVGLHVGGVILSHRAKGEQSTAQH